MLLIVARLQLPDDDDDDDSRISGARARAVRVASMCGGDKRDAPHGEEPAG